MSMPGKFHTNILINSKDRESGDPSHFFFTLTQAVHVPLGTQAFIACTRWSIDTSQTPTRAERDGQSLQLFIDDIVMANDVVDMGRGGVTVPCIGYIPTIDNGRNVARMTTSTAHPAVVPGGMNLRRFQCQVRDYKGDLIKLTDGAGNGGEWEADLLLIIYTTPTA